MKQQIIAPTIRVSDAMNQPQSDKTINSESKATLLSLDQIKADESLQTRCKLNKAMVRTYADRMLAGDAFPPVIIFKINDELFLVDGFHRFNAAMAAGFKEIAVEIRAGDRTEAIKFALEANASHGLPRTNADKRHCVLLALDELPQLSDRSIAKLFKVSQPFVSKVRRQLITVIAPEKRLGRDGRHRNIKCPSGNQGAPMAVIPEKNGDGNDGTQGGNAGRRAEHPASDDIWVQIERNLVAAETRTYPFLFADEWDCVKRFLDAVLTKCPADAKGDFAQALHKFADAIPPGAQPTAPEPDVRKSARRTARTPQRIDPVTLDAT